MIKGEEMRYWFLCSTEGNRVSPSLGIGGSLSKRHKANGSDFFFGGVEFGVF